MASARFMCFSDLLASNDPSQNGLIRVIGKVESYSIQNSLLTLQDASASGSTLQIAVDTSNIEPFPPKVGVLHQFIGEADYRNISICGTEEQKWVVLKALAHRCMDGLNMEVYLKSNAVRMIDLGMEVQSCGT